MMPSHLRLAAIAALLILSACSFANDTLWPSLSGEDPRGPGASPVAPAAVPATAEAGGVSSVSTVATGEAPAPTGIGRKVAELRGDLQRLQTEIAQHSAELDAARRQLDETAGGVDTRAEGIETRLKSRAAPNDPQLLADWNDTQTQLNRTSEAMARLTNISTWATSDAAHASYILQAVRAANGQPGTSDAERRQLTRLERDADRASLDVDRLVSQASGEIAGRNLFVATAHRRLAALSAAITAGRPVGAVAVANPARAAPAAAARQALVTIRFDRPNVAYEEALFGAVNEALGRRPDIAFDIVAISPPGQSSASAEAAKRNVESVVQSLASMGLPPERIRLSARTLADASGNEVRIYPR